MRWGCRWTVRRVDLHHSSMGGRSIFGRKHAARELAQHSSGGQAYSSTLDFRGLGAIFSASVLGFDGCVSDGKVGLCELDPLVVFEELVEAFSACGNGTDETWVGAGGSVLALAALDDALVFFFCFFLDGFDEVEAGSDDDVGRY